MRPPKKKLYAYVDESGQDTLGLVFVVCIMVLEGEKMNIENELALIEKESGKNNMKWHKSKRKYRQAYIEKISNLSMLKRVIFYEAFSDTKKYIELASFATAKAILKKSGNDDYLSTVFIDGFRKKEINVFQRGLRDLRIKTRKIRGVKKDENNVMIRLVDAICGLVRDARDGDEWSMQNLEKMKSKKLVSEL